MAIYPDPPERARDNLSSSIPTLWWLLVVVVAAMIFCLPFVRSIFFMGDEGVLLHGAERILRGKPFYVDFFEFLPPGGFVLTAAWLGLAGTSILSARLLAITTITAIACLIFLTCRQASKHSELSAIVAIGWLGMSQGFWTQLNHHWFTTLFSMIAFWATLAGAEYSYRWLRPSMVAGMAAGAAAMVTPTRGALAMMAGATAYLAGATIKAN